MLSIFTRRAEKLGENRNRKQSDGQMQHEEGGGGREEDVTEDNYLFCSTLFFLKMHN